MHVKTFRVSLHLSRHDAVLLFRDREFLTEAMELKGLLIRFVCFSFDFFLHLWHTFEIQVYYRHRFFIAKFFLAQRKKPAKFVRDTESKILSFQANFIAQNQKFRVKFFASYFYQKSCGHITK